MKHKLLIISRNKLPIAFWYRHLKLSEITVFKLENPDMAALNIQTIQPDAIVIDNYFCSEDCDKWLKAAVAKIEATKYNAQLFCLSPIYAFRKRGTSLNLGTANCFYFNEEFLVTLRASLGNPNNQYQPQTYCI